MKENYNESNLIENHEKSEFGLSIIPVSSQKKPFRPWAEHQTKISPISNWHSHFTNQGTVGIITGAISGNLEILDFDLKNDPEGTIWDEFVELIPQDMYNRFLIQTTPNGGYHIIYRCEDATIEKNLKLALHTDQAVIIETRGEGGYFCHSSINNKVVQGNFKLNDLDVDIPVLTSDEREFLLETARSLTRYFKTITPTKNKKNDEPFTYKEPAINEFNNKYQILDLFTKYGWEIVDEDDDKYYLLRDGSSAAHSGYYFKESKTFFCFSTSTVFEPEKPYNHFQILQKLEGNDDYKTALRLLNDYGYNVSSRRERVTTDDIAEYLNDAGVQYDSFIQDLTLNGKVIDEMDYNTLFIDLKKHFDGDIARSKFEETIKSHYITRVNPIEDFIEQNSFRRPTGTFDKWLDCIELQNPNIDRSIVLYFIKKWYTGMIAQALGGEYSNEYFLALLSVEQGIGKTTLLRKYTLPKELQDYRTEHPLNSDDDFKVMMSQSLLIIDDEMDGRTYEQSKTFNTIMSEDEIKLRRKYDRRISTIKRRCSFAGSGNNLNVIREHKNRRIIPLEISQIYYDKLLEVDYADLFMEAYNLYIKGFKYSYNKEDSPLLEQLYSDYVQKTDVDLVLDEYVLPPESDEDNHQISALDLVTTLAIHFPYFSFMIRSFATGEECLQHLDESPDIVVLDYYLNSREKKAANGIDILKEIKSLDKSLPVVMLSSQKNFSVAAQSIQHGAVHYVVKGQKAFGEVRQIIAANV